MRTVTWDLAGQVSACIDRLHALSSRRGTAGCRQRGKVLCVQQHPYVLVIGSLAFESLFKILGGTLGQEPCDFMWYQSESSRTDMLLLDTTATVPAAVTLSFDLQQMTTGRLSAARDYNLAVILIALCSITLPKTPAIQHAKIKNKSIWCSCKICC